METLTSADVVSGLKRLGNSTLVNDELFSSLLVGGIGTITQSAYSHSTGFTSMLFIRLEKHYR